MKPVTLEWIKIAEGDWATANREIQVDVDTNYRAVSFHAQQCGEKYLKAYLQERSINPERTHNLEILLDRILPFEPSWIDLKECCVELTDFAVEHRYPGATTLPKDAENSIGYAERIREKVRKFFQL